MPRKNLRGEDGGRILGKTTPTKDFRGVAGVKTSDRAFTTLRKLYNTVGHELVHANDFTSGAFRGWYDSKIGLGKQSAYNYAFYRTEANAYHWNVLQDMNDARNNYQFNKYNN